LILIATTLNNFQLKLVDESILKYDNDLNGAIGEIYFQDIVIPSNNQNLEIIKENLQVFAEINYTHLFVKSNEGFFINEQKVTSIFPMHEKLLLKEGKTLDFNQDTIQIYVNECFKNKHNVSINSQGYLQYFYLNQ